MKIIRNISEDDESLLRSSNVPKWWKKGIYKTYLAQILNVWFRDIMENAKEDKSRIQECAMRFLRSSVGSAEGTRQEIR